MALKGVAVKELGPHGQPFSYAFIAQASPSEASLLGVEGLAETFLWGKRRTLKKLFSTQIQYSGLVYS